MPRILPIVLLLFYWQSAACQTTIVAWISKDVMYVGADSRLLSPQLNPLTNRMDTVISSICKIRSVNNFNFAVSGNFLNTSLSVAVKACEKGTSFENVFTTYANQILRKLKDTLQVVRETNKSEFERMRKEGSVTKIIFFGFQKNKPQLTMFDFFIRRLNDEHIEIGIRTSMLNNSNIWVVGNFQNIKLQAFLSTTWSGGPVNGINNLIRIEQRAAHSEVGNPIDILEIKAREKKWIQKKDSCE